SRIFFIQSAHCLFCRRRCFFFFRNFFRILEEINALLFIDWIYFLHGFTIINKCLLFPLFFFKKNNSAANRLLALLILLPAVPVAADFFIYSGYLKDFPYILFLYQVIINFFGPVY